VALVLALLRGDLEVLERDGSPAMLRAIATSLTPEEHHRLAAEVASGDLLAQLVATVVLATPVILGSGGRR
jgi:hypothetical protein